MSDLDKKRSDNPLAPSQREERRLFRLLPTEFQKPVGFFWACNQHVLASPLALVTRLQLWIAKEGLTAEEVKTVLARCSTPERCAEFQFAGQLLAAVASEVSEALRRRRADEKLSQIRASDAAAREDKATPEEMAKLRQMFSTVDD